MIRRNPGDEDLRRLERLAAQGDPGARQRLAIERRRRGGSPWSADDPIFDARLWTPSRPRGAVPGCAWLIRPDGRRAPVAVGYLAREWYDVVRVDVDPAPEGRLVVRPDTAPWLVMNDREHAWPRDAWGSSRSDTWDESASSVKPALYRFVVTGYLYNGARWVWAVVGAADTDPSHPDSAEQRVLGYLNHRRLTGVPVSWLGYPTIGANMAPETVASWKREHARVQKALPADDLPGYSDMGEQVMQYVGSRRKRTVDDRSRINRSPFYPSAYMRWARQYVPDAFRNMLPEDALGPKWPSKKQPGWDLVGRVAAMASASAPTASLGARMLAFMVELDRMAPADRLTWATQSVGHSQNTRPARRLFPDRPRGFVNAAIGLRNFAEWSAWADDRATMSPRHAERVGPDQAATNRFDYALLVAREALLNGATRDEAAEALAAIRLTDVGAGIRRGDPVDYYLVDSRHERRASPRRR